MHGRGWILRLARLFLGSEPVRFDIGDGCVMEGSLDDWMTLWAFMRLHERDAPFQRSLALIRPGDVAVDVGAHAGIWSLLAAARGARVHAFEAVPEMAERLRDHARINGQENNIVVHVAAAGAEVGLRPFFAVREGNSGASSFASGAGEEIEVPVVTLDSIVDRADVLKVDVEGAEIQVLHGARRLLSGAGAPAIFFEMDDALCARFGTSGREVKQLLVEYGYHVYRWRDAAFISVSVEEAHGHEDLFAMKS